MKQRILFPFLLLLLLAACTKENLDPRMEIFVEKMQGNGKLTLDGVNATWDNGDTIRLNGTFPIVERDNGHAYLRNAVSQSTNRALFPTCLVTSGPATDNITVTLPHEYDYRSDGSHQILTLPMAARASDGEALNFKHLTGALCFVLNNTSGHALTIDRITVTSSAYQLSGERSINLNNIESLGSVTCTTAADRTVSMTFTKQTLVINHNGTANVVLPIAPVGSDNIFTVTVSCHDQGFRYTFTKTQGESKTDRSLSRNQIGYAAMTLSGGTPLPLFTGNGDGASPYYITNSSEFLLMVEAISNNWKDPNEKYYNTCDFRLSNTIDLSGTTINPIRGFRNAQFDGNGKTLRNLTINSRGDTCAFFSNPISVTLSDLTLENLTLKHSGNADNLFLSGFCGYLRNSSLQNCDVNGLTLSVSGTVNNLYFGSLAAYAYQDNDFDHCDFTTANALSLSATAIFYGNLIGRSTHGGEDHNLSLSNCTATTSAVSLTSTTGIHYAGGLVGHNSGENLTLNTCSFNGTFTLSAPTSTNYISSGGLAGRHQKSSSYGTLTTSNCTVQGSISLTSSSEYAYVGAYFGMSNVSPNFSSCTKSITLSLNGTSVNKEIGNQP